ncbi:hypothetical protein N9H93_01825 [Rhizobiaceae bacterium]|nr:hypothetical protein [Rhizobiaceae bacterium]
MSQIPERLAKLVETTPSGFARTFKQPGCPEKDDDRTPLDHWNTGDRALDGLLPEGVLSAAAIHEIEPLRPTDMPSLTGFAFALLARLSTMRPVIWCVTRMQVGDYGHLYAHGCQRFGLSPAQIVFVRVDHPLQLHFALEEALKTHGTAAVIGEGPLPSFTGSRRLSLLAKVHGTPCLLLNPKAGEANGSAAQTRWQVEPTVGVTDPHDPFGPGLPTWHVALTRCRGGHTSDQARRIVWHEQTRAFRAASAFSDGAVSESRESGRPVRQALVARSG